MKSLLNILKTYSRKRESTFISPRYWKYERIYTRIYNYLYKKSNNWYNTYINWRGYYRDNPELIKIRAFMLDLVLTWLVFCVVLLCILQPNNLDDVIGWCFTALGIAVLSPVAQSYIKWYFRVREKPFKE